MTHAVGVDFSVHKLRFTRHANPKVAQADGMCLPFADKAFACVMCSEVIEHIPEEDGRLIDELTRVLEPGGTLVLATPDYGTWQWPMFEFLYGLAAPGAYADEHVTRYSLATLTEALRNRGYEILDHDYICHADLVVRARKPE